MSLNLRIHHGAVQVGGNCIELECEGRSLLLDLGLPLDAPPTLPPVSGLVDADPSLLGVVLSHPHLDHYGLLPEVRPDLPVWIGSGAKRLLEAAAPFTGGAVLPQRLSTYESGAPFMVGPFKLTPYLMDHSAFDAHALLIEAGGRRLFYSGDFRGHGRKAQVFERFIAAPPAAIDVLLMEGTSIGRTEAATSERDVEAEAHRLMSEHPGLMLLCFSGQNIDRCVSFLRASMRSGRSFVIDPYMAGLISALKLPGLPDITMHPQVRVYLPKAQKRMIVRNQRFDLIEPYRKQRIFLEQLLAAPGRYSLMFRNSLLPDLRDADLAGGGLIYSLWPGYLDRDRTDLRSWAAAKAMSFQVVHSSGHAHRGDLKRMVAALKPERLIPIHTDKPESFADLYERVQQVPNGEWVRL